MSKKKINHYLFGLKITFLYFIGWALGIKSLRQKYGWKLFHWTMPYKEQEGFEVTLHKI